jgi:hypothetical protein
LLLCETQLLFERKVAPARRNDALHASCDENVVRGEAFGLVETHYANVVRMGGELGLGDVQTKELKRLRMSERSLSLVID